MVVNTWGRIFLAVFIFDFENYFIYCFILSTAFVVVEVESWRDNFLVYVTHSPLMMPLYRLVV